MGKPGMHVDPWGRKDPPREDLHPCILFPLSPLPGAYDPDLITPLPFLPKSTWDLSHSLGRTESFNQFLVSVQ